MIFSPVVGIIGLLFGLEIIYLRGYLVPGTPTLTERYFPDWVLRYFEHDASPVASNTTAASLVSEHNNDSPASVLQIIELIEPCRNETDLCLTDKFATVWRSRISALGRADYPEILGEWLGRDPATLTIEQGSPVRVISDERQLARWESEAAMLADLAAIPELQSQHPQWEKLNTSTQSHLLYSLRIFLNICPICNSEIEMSKETVESCCRSIENTHMYCTGCNSRILKAQM